MDKQNISLYSILLYNFQDLKVSDFKKIEAQIWNLKFHTSESEMQNLRY